MQQIHHKKNEIQEVEFFKDKECTEAFDFKNAFKNAKNLYIDGLNGDCTPLVSLPYGCEYYIPYIPVNIDDTCLQEAFRGNITTLDDITPNLSKYIPEDNAVLFLSEESLLQNRDTTYPREHCYMQGNVLQYITVGSHACKKFSIFLPNGTQSEIQKANEISKELNEKYGVEEVNLFVLHCFSQYIDASNVQYTADLGFINQWSINKIITTNSTGILPIQDNERLQVIDAKEIFEEYLKEII